MDTHTHTLGLKKADADNSKHKGEKVHHMMLDKRCIVLHDLHLPPPPHPYTIPREAVAVTPPASPFTSLTNDTHLHITHP